MQRLSRVLWAIILLLAFMGGVRGDERHFTADQIPVAGTVLNPWALLIDAGSTGSRMHLYEWSPRVFGTLPPPISKPFTSEVWTERMQPGISTFADNYEGVGVALTPLIDFAKTQLMHLADKWDTFPIFLKATAGMRELPLNQREGILDAIRIFLIDNVTCPFSFKNLQQARVMAGEEEAAYAWAGVNFASGALLGSEWGTGGTATPASAFGTLEMGGASSQIAFFQPEQSIITNFFKLQVGAAMHWNIYAHSFLQYGRVSARARMWSTRAEKAGCFAGNVDDICVLYDACLARGMSVQPFNEVTGRVEVHPPEAYHPMLTRAVVKSGEAEAEGANTSVWEACLAQIVEPLGFGGATRKEANKWCNYSHLGQCSFAGEYQPEIPNSDSAYGDFFLIGEYVDVWEALGLDHFSSTLGDLRRKGSEVCALDQRGLEERFGKHTASDVSSTAQELCFLSAFVFSMLHHGHGFGLERNFTAVKTMTYGGTLLKAGWQLGSILYEINSLPWTYDPDLSEKAHGEMEQGSDFTSPSSSSSLLYFTACLASSLLTILAMKFLEKRVDRRQQANPHKETHPHMVENGRRSCLVELPSAFEHTPLTAPQVASTLKATYTPLYEVVER